MFKITGSEMKLMKYNRKYGITKITNKGKHYYGPSH